jgi:hypothetical protein
MKAYKEDPIPVPTMHEKEKEKPHTKTSLVCSKVLRPVEPLKISKMWGLGWHDLRSHNFQMTPPLGSLLPTMKQHLQLLLIPSPH